MTFTTPSPSVRLRRGLRAAALVAASFGAFTTAVAFDGGTVSAESAGLPVNALAPEITNSARAAVAALDAYAESGSVADEQTLAWHRAATARYTARQLGYDELAMVHAWGSTGLSHQRAVLGALTQVGVPYRSNTSIENEGFDCSGLTTYAWKGAGLELTRQSGAQISQAERLDREQAMAGDLVHYPGHVMLYLGVDDAIVHSVMSGRTVEVDTIRRGSVSFGDPTHTR
ncbi:C40 family peptidase [Ilumatobacter sp.]|uniref:C40 family peptidase n=1 Tax=Ilumatobacter sp. TaxID=1967498 RepID=UPI003C57D02B